MLDYRDILNKYFVIKLSVREISRQTGMSKSGVQKFIHAFEKCEDLDFPLPPGITNAGIAMKVYGKVPGEGGRDESYEYPDYPKVLKLMNERKNMTLQVCWDRYVKRCMAEEKKPYQYRLRALRQVVRGELRNSALYSRHRPDNGSRLCRQDI